MTSVVTTATPKIVGKALYLELVANPDLPVDKVKSALGWQYDSVKQVIIFPQYQDDTGRTHEVVMISRIVSNYSPKAQWNFDYLTRFPKPLTPEAKEKADKEGSYYYNFDTYSSSEWAELTEREKYEARNLALDLLLRGTLLDATSQTNESGESVDYATSFRTPRDNKPFSVEVTDEDYDDIHRHRKTPQAVIRRINKVRDTLDKFPSKLA